MSLNTFFLSRLCGQLSVSGLWGEINAGGFVVWKTLNYLPVPTPGLAHFSDLQNLGLISLVCIMRPVVFFL